MNEYSDFIILQSYTTIVAAFQRTTGWNYPKKVNLYNDSRTGKRAAQKNVKDDFASVIATALNQH